MRRPAVEREEPRPVVLGVSAATALVAPGRRRLLIGIGGDAAALDEDMLDVDFPRWVQGEDLPVTQLKGQLGTKSPAFRLVVRRRA